MKRHLWTAGILLLGLCWLGLFAGFDDFAGETPLVAVAVFWLLSGVIMLAPMLLARWRPLRGMAVYSGALLAIWLVPWNPQKQFIRDLHRIPVGASVSEARASMARWCKLGDRYYSVHFENALGTTVFDPLLGRDGRLVIPTACAFRGTNWHEEDRNGDGEVRFANGRVTGVRFESDD